jgi:hypothetical protein
VTVNGGTGSSRLTAVSVGLFSNAPSAAYSRRINDGVRTSNRAEPASTIRERGAAALAMAGQAAAGAARHATATAHARPTSLASPRARVMYPLPDMFSTR